MQVIILRSILTSTDFQGLYGCIAAKSYLQLHGAYDKEPSEDFHSEVPPCFTKSSAQGDALLIVDSASCLGGTWATVRLYPNLLSQNSYGLYEFSDLPLASVVPPDPEDADNQFIAGWKINRYLHVWCEKWDLLKYMRFNWKVKEYIKANGVLSSAVLRSPGFQNQSPANKGVESSNNHQRIIADRSCV